jgi:hypothetical protein
MHLFATTIMHDHQINRFLLPIIAYAMVFDHLLCILCLQLENKSMT